MRVFLVCTIAFASGCHTTCIKPAYRSYVLNEGVVIASFDKYKGRDGIFNFRFRPIGSNENRKYVNATASYSQGAFFGEVWESSQ